MATHKTIEYTCDRCGKTISKPYRKLEFIKDISDLWKPKTWGEVSRTNHDFCENCFDSFLRWLRKK